MSVNEKPSWLKHLDFIAVDLVCLAAAFVLSYWLKFGDLSFAQSGPWKSLFAMLLLANLAITLSTGPYSGVFRRSYWEDVGAYLKLALWSFLFACVAFYLLKIGERFSREMLVVTYLAYLAASLAAKFALKRNLLSRGRNRPADSFRRMVLVCEPGREDTDRAAALADDMAAIEVVGSYVPAAGGAVEPGALAQLAAESNADEVLVMCDPSLVGAPEYERLVEDGVRVRFGIAEAFGVSAESQRLGRAGVVKTVDLERYSFGQGQLLYLPVKRLFDVLFGVVGCALATVVALFVKVAYLASGDAHPIFYSQVRVGQRGKPFRLHKIRSMVWDADEVLAELLEDPALAAEWERDQKLENDPRVTPVGRVLRRTSLDELPQFVNVLKGDMSLVGPRPLVPGELEEHGGRPLYNKVRPGITGWWACNGRSNIEYRERLELEYHYVRHCSLYLDVLCVFRTLVGVLKREGAV